MKNYIFTAIVFFVSFGLTFLFTNKISLALNEKQFSINYDISYSINENGEANVEQQVYLVNLKNDVVPTTYTFNINKIKVYDIYAEANGKKVNAQQSDSEDGSTITVPLINYVIGKDKENKLTIKYKTNDIMIKTGNIWYLFIPKIQVPETTQIYDVKVQIPEKLGPKMYFSPSPYNEKKEGSSVVYYLNKDNFKGSGITAAFGNSQIINFNLKYQIENPNIIFSKYKIPLPPDIKGYQETIYSKISPKPRSIQIDSDGNPMAVYLLSPKQKLEIEVVGSAKVLTHQIDTDNGGSFSELPKDLVKKYTSEKKFWQTKTRKITEAAKSLKNDKLSVSKNARLAYNFVVENLSYDFDAVKKDYVERQGSEAALTQKGSWSCMEFSDLFIALTRAMGIPSREINGYAINGEEVSKPLPLNLKNGDLLHSWAEFYDPNFGWVQVDPTWGNTSGIDYFSKTDTNHFTLVKRGLDSEQPQPAGAYRFDGTTQLVEIDFSSENNLDDFGLKASAKKVFNFNLLKVLKGFSKYVLVNEGNSFVYTSEGVAVPPGQSAPVYLPSNSTVLDVYSTGGVKTEIKL